MTIRSHRLRVAVGGLVGCLLVLGGAGIAVALAGASPGAPPQPRGQAAPRVDHTAAEAPSPAHDDADPTKATHGYAVVAERVQELAGPMFAGLVIDEKAKTITAYWVGSAPEAVRDYASTHPDGATILMLTSARFTRRQRLTALERLRRSAFAREVGVTVIEAGLPDGPVNVNVRGEIPDRAARERLARIARLPADAIVYVPHSDIDMSVPTLKK